MIAVMAFLLWRNDDGGTVGVGAYEAELAECQDFIWEMNQHPEGMEFNGRVWHREADDGLEIGGVLTTPDLAGRPEGFVYFCKIRDGRIILADVGQR